ncbi:hypothetical protein IC617_17610 [Neiella sp. HB171785]|uniref:Uncharacterized protein n=1 Tax=Neiella litorisoli TaxID=2771431 RepID=A0A8J6UQG7_9GAMM|nr:hypothetical protein [Neiella litorisoli]MBD1391247.1 hypothetical protein [Neiella litorisoli]
MAYEHKTKAGNLGDVFKHLTLCQLLDGKLEKHQGKFFCYADTFAGRPAYPIEQSKGWRKGAAKLLDITVPPLSSVRYWHQHVSATKTQKEPYYPGSSKFAEQLIVQHGFKPQLLLWDTSEVCVNALKDSFPQAKFVGQNEVKVNDLLLEQADFVLVDPPGIRSRRHPDYPSWQSLAEMMALPVDMLMWLPLPDSLTSSRNVSHRDIRKLAVSMNLTVSEVTWNTTGMLGCQLLYRADPLIMGAARRVIDWMAHTMKCQAKHFDITSI